jgi:hypothetical protein
MLSLSFYLFKKEYDLNSEEAIRRYRVFKSNLNFIREQNKKGLTYTLGVNHLADFTFEELNISLLSILISEFKFLVSNVLGTNILYSSMNSLTMISLAIATSTNPVGKPVNEAG